FLSLERRTHLPLRGGRIIPLHGPLLPGGHHHLAVRRKNKGANTTGRALEAGCPCPAVEIPHLDNTIVSPQRQRIAADCIPQRSNCAGTLSGERQLHLPRGRVPELHAAVFTPGDDFLPVRGKCHREDLALVPFLTDRRSLESFPATPDLGP